jgi:hypothetical protein
MPAYFEPAACEECAAVAPSYAATGHLVANIDDQQRGEFCIWLHAWRYAYSGDGDPARAWTYTVAPPPWADGCDI